MLKIFLTIHRTPIYRAVMGENSANMYFFIHPIKKATKQYTNEKQRKQQNI
ncbi:hypothetical protein [Capnocytophaga gingivalis]|uniref:hypothetical protein n=1 Tax=Capnocytophaga gingivalis TaxID=1017 RepID=UPI0028F1213D|nr:hypothetical protein [Capnocytophaga gingivalis]